jgi:outer membrane immunogenic protein
MRISLALAAGLLTVVAGAAQAADLPRRSAAAAPAPIVYKKGFTWTGGYVGATAGYGWGSHTGRNGGALLGKPKGALFGVTAGYNQQYGNIVAGVEGDFSGDTQKATRTTPGMVGKSRVRSLATARARIGVAVDRALIYATGGYAGGSVNASLRPTALTGSSKTQWLNGYAAGAGVEYAVTDNVTVKGEYLYAHLAGKQFSGTGGAPGMKTGVNDHVVRAGANYKF